MDLNGKHITVIGSEPGLGDMVNLISINLNADQNDIRVRGVQTHELTSKNVGDVVISPDSLLSGTVHGSTNITEHVRRAVNSQIPIVVMVLANQKPQNINPIDGLEGVIGLYGMKDLPEALRIALQLSQ